MQPVQNLLKRKWNLATIGISVVLVGFIGFLVLKNYLSQIELQEHALEQLRHDTEKHATAVSYFYSERKNDLKNLAESREISIFFENKALGMSMEYGLRASLQTISESFGRFLEERRIGKDRIYTRIAFVESNGEILADTQPKDAKQKRKEDLKKFLTSRSLDVAIIDDSNMKLRRVAVSIPYFFKNKYVGGIIAFVSPDTVYKHFVKRADRSSKRAIFVSCEKGEIHFPAEMEFKVPLPLQTDLTNIEIEKTHQFNVPCKNGTRIKMLAIRIPVKDTPFSLVQVLPATEVLGETSPWHMPLAMGVVSLSILSGMAIVLRINAHNLVLNTRLEESSIREREIGEKNLQLQKEILERKRVENALQRAHDELEIRVQERTRELEKTNEALTQSEEKHRMLIENIQDCVFIIQDAKLQFVNEAFTRMMGYSTEKLIGMDFRQLVAPEDLEMVSDRYLRRQAGESVPNEYEFRMLHKDGVTRVVVNMNVGLINYQGRVASMGTLKDITERKLAEEAVRQSEEKYRTIVENIQDAYLEVDLAGNFTFVNDAECRNLGYTREELIGMNYRQYTDETIARKLYQTFNGVYRTGESVKVLDVEVIKKSGTKAFNEISVSLIRDSKGNPIGFRGVARDVTERKRAEEEKTALQEQLRQSQKMEAIGKLAGGVAHDFNNLLTVIHGYSKLMLNSLDQNSRFRQDVQEILNASERASSLTCQLLAFSRKQLLQPKVLDLNTHVSNMDIMLRRMIGENIELLTLLAKDLGRIKVDPGQIEQVILNLAVNAKDAMLNGGKLTIGTANVLLDESYARSHIGVTPGHYVMLSVSDTGSGMTPEIKERIFEPFFTTKEKGTGLGLSTVYGIIQQSGGNVWVYSEPGVGTTFKIYLPTIEEDTESLRPTALSTKATQGFETILLVEDEEIVRKLACKILQNYGYTVLEAPNGEEALRIVQGQNGNPIHLMVTDVVMPGMSGRQLAERLVPLWPEMKVLYMSGYTDNAIVHHGVLDPGIAYIQKPFTPDAIAHKVREVLNRG